MAYAIPSPLACIGQLDAQEMSQSDMVSGPGPRFADQRVKSLSEAKTITTQHILKPGDPRSWQTFKGEFRSAIDAEALPALNRAKPYTLAECYEMLPADNRTDKAAADLLSRLNWLYDSASDYILSSPGRSWIHDLYHESMNYFTLSRPGPCERVRSVYEAPA